MFKPIYGAGEYRVGTCYWLVTDPTVTDEGALSLAEMTGMLALESMGGLGDGWIVSDDITTEFKTVMHTPQIASFNAYRTADDSLMSVKHTAVSDSNRIRWATSKDCPV